MLVNQPFEVIVSYRSKGIYIAFLFSFLSEDIIRQQDIDLQKAQYE